MIFVKKIAEANILGFVIEEQLLGRFQMNNSDFIIVGDTERGECLVLVVGRKQEYAEEALERMLNNPTENDKRLMEGHSNFRIKEVPAEDCWWRDV